MTKNDTQVLLDHLQDISLSEKRILVTGGAGFLGSWMCETIIRKEGSVICADNLSSGRYSNIEHLIHLSQFTFVNHDISHPLEIDGPLDYVMHLASRASPLEFTQYPLEILKSNTLGTMNALEIARKFDASFLFTSTSEIYGDPSVTPTPETYRGNVNTIGIRGCYDEAKRAGEAICMAFHREYGTDVRIARIFNTYGPKMRSDGHYGRVVPRFIDQALNNRPITIFGDGLQTRSFCYVTDQIEGLVRLACIPELTGTPINIGNPLEVTIIDLAKRIIDRTGSKSELEFHELPEDDPRRRCPDISRARELLNWAPKVDLNTGLDAMIQVVSRIKQGP